MPTTELEVVETPGARLRKLREERGLDQKTLGKMVGRSGSQVSSWEADRHRPDTDCLIALEELLGIPISAWKREPLDSPSPALQEAAS